MSEEERLKALLKLLDDESSVVRTEVTKALKEYGTSLEKLLHDLDEVVDPGMIGQVLELIGESEPDEDADDAVNDVPELEGRFKIGQLVQHRQYQYRGVVVHYDRVCEADETWYRNNRTQPERNQRWYHVLVHDSSQVTYAAESNLEIDQTGERIVHPFVAHFFDGFEGGQYIRNDQPWPDIWNL